MEMLRGSRILLDGEPVEDVFIGLPSADGREYTLGIPKGDTHEWCDRKVSFGGRMWRTIGLPETGEAANIPLRWGKNIKVRLHEGSGVTVYECDSYLRHFYADAEYLDLRGRKVNRTGAQPADTVNVLLYSCNDTDGYTPKAGDIIVSGECAFVFDISTERAAAESMNVFRESCPGYAVIKAVTAEKNGLKHDIHITAG